MAIWLIILLLLGALVLPVLGAVVVRLLWSRLSALQRYGLAAMIFAVAAASVLVLSRSNISNVQVGNLTLVLPVTGPEVHAADFPPLEPAEEPGDTLPIDSALPAGTSIAEPTAPPAVESTVVQATVVPTEEPTAEPTEAPTATPSPTEAPTEVPTEVPTEAPAGPRTYTVQPGDTLRGIAAQFDVTVEALLEANDLSPEEADALRIGQELIIP